MTYLQPLAAAGAHALVAVPSWSLAGGFADGEGRATFVWRHPTGPFYVARSARPQAEEPLLPPEFADALLGL